MLKIPHHGRDTSSTHTFLRIVDADYYVVPGGKDLAKSVKERLIASDGEIYTTEKKGTIICRSDGMNITFEFKKTSKVMQETTIDEQVGTEIYYVGNMKSKKYHLSWCNSVTAMAEKNKVLFDAKQEAIDNGYTGCAVCRP